jgi:hypothetical protein
VDIMTAGPGASFDRDAYDALVVGSPVYGAMTRPPIRSFIDASAPLAVPVFAYVTGWFPDTFESNDLPALEGMLNRAGARLIAAIKIKAGTKDAGIKERTQALIDGIDEALARGQGARGR